MGEISTTNDNKYTYIIVMSMVMMLSLIIIPFSTGWRDGLIPEVDDLGQGLFNVFQEFVEDSEGAWRNIVVRGTLFAAICDAVMALAAVCKSKIMSILSALGGIITMVWSLFMYIDINDFDAVFDFEDCGTTIGFWIPFILFIICFVLAVSIPEASNDTSIGGDGSETPNKTSADNALTDEEKRT